MKLAPTLEGGLRIDAEGAEDWIVLDAICADAAHLPGPPLYDQVSEHMPEDSDWEEFVASDIRNQFSDQIAHVSRAISSAKRDENQMGAVFVEKEDAMTWYGAINQARMTLEQLYQVSSIDDFLELDDMQDLSEEKHSALIRSHFYSAMQSLLLDYVLD